MPRKLFAAISQIVLGALIVIAPQTFAPLHRSGRSGTGCRHRIAGNNRIFRAKPGQGRIGYRQCRAGRACRSGADHAGRRMQRLHDALPYGDDADAYRIGRAAGGARSSRRISRSQAGKAWLTCRISPLRNYRWPICVANHSALRRLSLWSSCSLWRSMEARCFP